MRNIKNRILILLVIVISLFGNTIMSYAKTTSVTVYYFGSQTCYDCYLEFTYLESLRDEADSQGHDFKLIYYNETSNIELLHSYGVAFSIPEQERNLGGVAFVGDKYYFSLDEMKTSLKEQVLAYFSNPESYNPVTVKNTDPALTAESSAKILSTFTPLTVFLGGLIDGINPCAIAMLLFFISFAISTNQNKKQILWMGLFFIFGSFIAYFGIGLGFLKFMMVFQGNSAFLLIAYVITSALSLVFLVANFLDYLRLKRGDLGEVKTLLPKGLRHKIQNYVRGRKFGKFMFATAFVSGFIISFLELFCTGQIYVPTLTYLLGANVSTAITLGYLLIYNIAFVVPLSIVCFALYKGKDAVDVTGVLLKKIHTVKLINCGFFACVLILMVIQLCRLL